jgi:DNA-binding NtrC family response regulator
MELLVDRFVALDATHVVDLATGDPIVLVIASAGEPADQRRWAIRCDTLCALRHVAIAPLVDYGLFGTSQVFEAWRSGPLWSGSPLAARRVVERASTFLRACGLSPGAMDAGRVRRSLAGPIVLPDAQAGYPLDAAATLTGSLDEYGIAIRSSSVVSTLAELFEPGSAARPRVVALWGDCGAGKSTALAELARLARAHGFVPVAVSVLEQLDVRTLLGGRTLFLIADDRPAAWNALVAAAINTPKSHVLIVASEGELDEVDGLSLPRFAADALAAAVRPVPTSSVADRIRRASRRSNGLPGRFVALLWGGNAHKKGYGVRHRRTLRAAEQPAVYGIEESTEPPSPISGIDHHAWPAPGEIAALRKRMETARGLIARGRHAPGERTLRQSIGALARRGAAAHAAEGLLLLASCLLERGRANDARDAIADIAGRWDLAQNGATMVDAAILAGEAWIDLARLDEAESVLGAALAQTRASHGGSDGPVLRALARCAFWRGQFADAGQLVQQAPAHDDPSTIQSHVLRARVAVGLRDLPSAVSIAVDACARARSLGDPALIAATTAAAAFAHLATNDLDACERDAGESVAAARIARKPLAGIRARVLIAESTRRRGHRSSAASLLDRLAAVGPRSLPAIVRARVALVLDLARDQSAVDIVDKHVRVTGLPALALFAPARASNTRVDEALGEVLEILQLCQAADDERTVLAQVAGRLKRQLHAAAIGFVVRDGLTLEPLASDGNRFDPEVARRAIDAGVLIAPHRSNDRIEAAAPVKYGGASIGAIVARWALGSTGDHGRASGVLTTAATAAAPVIAAAIAHRARPTSAGTSDIIGVSAAMGEMRLAIERTANAPFPVLINGESGSGKELVARALHRSGLRRDRPFCTLNCAALPDDLVEAELFGHARGSFTGAMVDRAGVFEEAHTGTLFLDEIGELSLRAQAKVLRVIQDGELKRIGENVTRRVEVRLIAATNRDLHAEAAVSRFRMDLLYRLDVIRITVPPLRDRREDVAPLAEHFWRAAARRVDSRATLAAATIAALARYDWPGNVRELQNVLAALAVRTPRRGVVPPSALPPPFGESRAADSRRLNDARRTFEQRFVRAALARAGGHRSRAASELGVTRQGLTKLMTRLGIE